MIRQKVVFLTILSLALYVAPAWALENHDGDVIKLIDRSRVDSAIDDTLPSKPVEISKNKELVPAPDAKVANNPSNVSWWSDFAQMVGLAESDPGLTIEPTLSNKAASTADYIIGPGDVIGISVWKDDSLTRTVVVLPDGKITFPLLGDLIAGGKTVAQLKQGLESGLTRYVADSNVTVEVKQSNSMIIYIIGRVNAPGRQVLVANTNVLQALAMAGGMNPFAKKSDVKIFRQEDGKTMMFLFDYNEVAEGRHLEKNIELKRGDVIIVP
jgi:polysaccharide biosynthesis/export protein